MGKDHVALVISLVWKRRSIPLCWLVKKGKKGHFPERLHLDLIKQAAALIEPQIPSSVAVTFLGDGEFDGVDLQTLCRQLGWHTVLRTAKNRVFYENEDRFQAHQTQTDEGQVFCFIPNVDFSDKRLGAINFLHWHCPAYKDPVFIVSDLDDPFKIMDLYRLRFSIETMFKDFKSRGFNMHKTRLKKAESIHNLLIIGSLAFCLIMDFGNEHRHKPIRKKVQAKKNQLSIFSFGLKLFHFLLEKGADFCFSLKFSKNSS